MYSDSEQISENVDSNRSNNTSNTNNYTSSTSALCSECVLVSGSPSTSSMPPETCIHGSQVCKSSKADSLVDGALCSKSETEESCSSKIHAVDAVHPFFTGYKNIKYDKSTSTDNQRFYCGQCEIYIDLCQEAVNEHFSTSSHRPIEHCVYCKTDVFEYFYNENRYYYHRCPKESPRGSHDKSSSVPVSSISSGSDVVGKRLAGEDIH